MQNSQGNTPLHYCASINEEAEDVVLCSVTHLLAAGAATNTLNKMGIAPLHWAVVKNNCKIMRQLLENNVDRADVDVRDCVGKTPLFYALRHADAMRLLIEFGADVNARDNGGRTPVKEAVERMAANESLDVVRILLDAGADPNVATNRGETALHMYFREPNAQVVKLLIERGANVNASSSSVLGSPLHFAAYSGSVECMRVLLRHGADVHARCPNGGGTALHLAAKSVNPRDAIQPLIEAGANVNAADDEGCTPIHVLIRHRLFLDERFFSPLAMQTTEIEVDTTLDTVRLLVANDLAHLRALISLLTTFLNIKVRK